MKRALRKDIKYNLDFSKVAYKKSTSLFDPFVTNEANNKSMEK